MEVTDSASIHKEISEGLYDIFGGRSHISLIRLLQLEFKASKYETKIVVLGEFSLHLVANKLPLKIEQTVNFASIRSLESTEPGKITVVTDSKRLVLYQLNSDSSDVDDLLHSLLSSMASVFPGAIRSFLSRVTLNPSIQIEDIENRLTTQREKVSGSPCGGFSLAYRCMCDYHGLPVVDEVTWDVDTIYLAHNSKEFVLNDFDHLDSRIFIPMLAALEFNEWFTKLSVVNLKLTSEAANEIVKVLKSNCIIDTLVICNTGLKWDFIQRVSVSLTANAGISLTYLDLSSNAIEDKGLIHLLPALGKSSSSLNTLKLSHAAFGARGINRLAETLCETDFAKTLRCLDLSDNSCKGEDITNLFNFLALPSHLQQLNLAGTECAVETLFGALVNGCHQHLTHLDVSRNVYSTKKSSRDSAVPSSWKEFFLLAPNLRFVNFSGTRLPTEAVRLVMEGLELNQCINSLELNLSANALGPSGAQVVESFIANIHSIAVLDISDNGLDQCLAGLLQQLGKNHKLKKLAIGKNLATVKSKFIPMVMESLVQMVQNNRSSLQCLMIDDMKLRSDLATLLGAVACNSVLTELDISGNLAGDVGARALSKSLALNRKLSSVYWDRNNTSPQGFSYVATSMQRNYTLTMMPAPTLDLASAARVNQEKTDASWAKVEAALRRNNATCKVSIDEAFRLHNGFIKDSSHQMLNTTICELNAVVSVLSKSCLLSEETQEEVGRGLGLIKDASSVNQLMKDLERIALGVGGETGTVQCRLDAMANDLQSYVQALLQTTTNEMIHTAEFQCPAVLSNGLHEEVKQDVMDLVQTRPENLLHDLVTRRIGYEVANIVNEATFKVATFLTEKIVEELLVALHSTLSSLKKVLTQRVTNDDIKEDYLFTKDLEDISRAEAFKKNLYCRRLRPTQCNEHVGITDPLASESRDCSMPSKSDMTAAPPCNENANHSSTETTPSKPPVAKFRKRASTGNCLKEQPPGDAVDAVEPDTHSPSDSHLTKSNSLASHDRVTGATLSTPCTTNGVTKKCAAVSRNKNENLQSAIDFDLSLMETSTPKLSHLCKDRPKARKTRSTLKPNVGGALPLISTVQPDVGFVAFFNEDPVKPDTTFAKCSSVASSEYVTQLPVVPASAASADKRKSLTVQKQSVIPSSTCAKPRATEVLNPSILRTSPIFARASAQEYDTKEVSTSLTDKPKIITSPQSLPRGRPPPLAPKPKKLGSTANVSSESGLDSPTASVSLSSSTAANLTSKSANSSPAKFISPSANRGFSVRQYLKRFADASSENDDITVSNEKEGQKENGVEAVDVKPPAGDAILKRRLSVREKAAFLEASVKDSSC